MDREKVIYDIERCICHVPDACRDCSHYGHGEVIGCMEELLTDALALLKEQDELLKHEYWRGYNNGRADERGLREGTIMQTFSPD